MNKIVYLSAFGFGFRDYSYMKKCIEECPDFTLGAEYGTSWMDSDFYENLSAQIEKMRGIPATIHSPFIEICTVPGSPEEEKMQKSFAKAADYYEAFQAGSMVIHTHEGKFAPEKQDEARARSREVLLQLYRDFSPRGIHLTVENVGYPHRGNVLFDYDHFVELFSELPDEIGCLIDTGHAMLNRWDMVKLIETLGPRVRGVHLNNNDGVHDSHYPTFDPEGFLSPQQMDDIVAALARYAPEADLILEYHPEQRFTQESLYEDVRRIARVWDAACK